ATWSRIAPATLRRRAQGPADEPPGHVWVMRRSAHGSTAHVAAGDRLHLLFPACPSQIELPAGVKYVQRTESRSRGRSAAPVDFEPGLLLQVTDTLTSPADLLVHPGDGREPWQVTLMPAPLRQGLPEAWHCCWPTCDH